MKIHSSRYSNQKPTWLLSSADIGSKKTASTNLSNASVKLGQFKIRLSKWRESCKNVLQSEGVRVESIDTTFDRDTGLEELPGLFMIDPNRHRPCADRLFVGELVTGHRGEKEIRGTILGMENPGFKSRKVRIPRDAPENKLFPSITLL